MFSRTVFSNFTNLTCFNIYELTLKRRKINVEYFLLALFEVDGRGAERQKYINNMAKNNCADFTEYEWTGWGESNILFYLLNFIKEKLITVV